MHRCITCAIGMCVYVLRNESLSYPPCAMLLCLFYACRPKISNCFISASQSLLLLVACFVTATYTLALSCAMLCLSIMLHALALSRALHALSQHHIALVLSLALPCLSITLLLFSHVPCLVSASHCSCSLTCHALSQHHAACSCSLTCLALSQHHIALVLSCALPCLSISLLLFSHLPCLVSACCTPLFSALPCPGYSIMSIAQLNSKWTCCSSRASLDCSQS